MPEQNSEHHRALARRFLEKCLAGGSWSSLQR